MPKISKKGRNMPNSPIRKLVPYALMAKEKGIKVYHLNIGQPDIKTPEVALNAIRNYDEKIIAYSESAGNLPYRKKLSKQYKENGINLSTKHILITTGGSEAILFALNSCCDAGDEIIIPEPFYANYNGFATIAGVKIVPVTSSIETDFALPPIEEFEKLITKKTKAILICNPNNPTGYLYSDEELEKLRKLVLKYDLYLFSDEVYREFCYGDNQHKSILQLEGLEENAVVFDSVSKRYSECGLRIGTLITRNKALKKTALKFGQARLCPPGLGQIVAEASLDTPQSYFDEVYEEYLSRRDFMVEALNQMEGVYCPTPKGAFYSIVRLPIDDCDRFAQWLLEDFSYKGQTVMVAPASGFYATKGLGKNEVRIAYVLKKEELAKAMKVLEEALKVYPGRKL